MHSVLSLGFVDEAALFKPNNCIMRFQFFFLFLFYFLQGIKYSRATDLIRFYCCIWKWKNSKPSSDTIFCYPQIKNIVVEYHTKHVAVLSHWNSCGNHCVPLIHKVWNSCGLADLSAFWTQFAIKHLVLWESCVLHWVQIVILLWKQRGKKQTRIISTNEISS